MAFEYTSVAQVVAILPKDVEVTTESKPTIAQVEVWITQAESTYDTANGTATVQDEKDMAAALCSGEVAYRVQLTRQGGTKEFAESAWMQYHKDFLAATGQSEDATSIVGVVTPSIFDPQPDPAFTRSQARNW